MFFPRLTQDLVPAVASVRQTLAALSVLRPLLLSVALLREEVNIPHNTHPPPQSTIWREIIIVVVAGFRPAQPSSVAFLRRMDDSCAFWLHGVRPC